MGFTLRLGEIHRNLVMLAAEIVSQKKFYQCISNRVLTAFENIPLMIIAHLLATKQLSLYYRNINSPKIYRILYQIIPFGTMQFPINRHHCRTNPQQILHRNVC